MRISIPKADLFEKLVLRQMFKNDPYFHNQDVRTTIIQVNSEAQLPYNTNNNYFGKDHEDTDQDENKTGGCWWQPKSSLLQEYFANSTMHGLKHVVRPQQHLLERVFWCCAILTAAICSVLLILVIWNRYHKTPVVVGFDPEDVDIKEVPFPSIVICNMNKVSLDTINQLLVRADKEGNSKLAVEARTNLYYAQTLCESSIAFSDHHNFSTSRGYINISKYNMSKLPGRRGMYAFLHKNPAVPCEKMIRGCMWNGRVRNCSNIFKRVTTSMGSCCSFNLMPLPLKSTSYDNFIQRSNVSQTEKDYSLQDRWDNYREWRKWNYTHSLKIPKGQRRPRTQQRAGAPFGLSVLLDPMAHRYFCPTTDSLGFRFGIFSPVEELQMERFSKVAELNREIFMQVVPTLTLAAPGLKRYSFERRQCLLEGEGKLKFFYPYTQKNCMYECAALYVSRKCSCVPYGMPGERERICSNSPGPDRSCFLSELLRINKNIHEYCSDCKPFCMELTYRTELTRARLQNSSWLWADHPETMRIPPDWADHEMAVLHVYFGENAYVSRLRREIYGITDLIANTGNLITLCLGASVLSIFEVIYFLTVRPVVSYILGKFPGRSTASAALANKEHKMGSVTIPPGSLRTVSFHKEVHQRNSNIAGDDGRVRRELLSVGHNFSDAWS